VVEPRLQSKLAPRKDFKCECSNDLRSSLTICARYGGKWCGEHYRCTVVGTRVTPRKPCLALSKGCFDETDAEQTTPMKYDFHQMKTKSPAGCNMSRKHNTTRDHLACRGGQVRR
jgi:hypothetical protein